MIAYKFRFLVVPLIIVLIFLASPNIESGTGFSSNVSLDHLEHSVQTSTSLPANMILSAPSDPSMSPIQEIPIPQNNSEPIGITIDTQGNVWFAENNVGAIGEYVLLQHAFRIFTIPTNTSGLIWFMIFDNSGNLWFSDTSQDLLWRFSPSTLQFANFSTGNQLVIPYDLAYDSTVNQIWFTSIYTDQIGNFQINGNSASLESLINVTGPTRALSNSIPRFGPAGIAFDAERNIFVTEPFSGSIVEYNRSLSEFTNVWSLSKASEPVGITVDNALNEVWFTNHATSLFGYINMKTGSFSEFATSAFDYGGDAITLPYWMQQSSDGSIWFNEHVGNKIARFDPSTRELTEYVVPTNGSSPLRFVIDNHRAVIWFTELTGNKLGELLENQTCSCSILSSNELTLSGSSSSFYAKYVSNISSSNNSFSAPSISGSLSADGNLDSNLSISTSKVNSSYYLVTLERGSNLESGNYSITICTLQSTSLAPINQCVESTLFVTSAQTSNMALTFLLAGAVIAVALVVSIVYVRKWRQESNGSEVNSK